ncbi:GNAT family N-acetyltransferase [Streptomyces sp. NPDC090085]|uniref:GNAT family N-acetyltransferase n=1 Tax=Streptomyces sp. NPDC090085 TaxID=3365943 RepID=UPI00382CC02A
MPSLELRYFGHDQAPDIRELLLDIHDEVYAELGEGTSFETRDRFAWFVDHWSARPGFSCVVGYDQGEPVGYGYGAPLGENAPNSWWKTLEPLDPGFTREDGTRTFAMSEGMVRKQWRGKGVAHRIHEEFAATRTEERLTLYVDGAHEKVAALYQSWGYEPVGQVRPFEDSPLFTVMIRPRLIP